MLYLKILAFILIAAGALLVFAARAIVEKYNLDENIKCEFEEELQEDELKIYKYNKATVNMKMIGMLVALPGFLMIVAIFK